MVFSIPARLRLMTFSALFLFVLAIGMGLEAFGNSVSMYRSVVVSAVERHDAVERLLTEVGQLRNEVFLLLEHTPGGDDTHHGHPRHSLERHARQLSVYDQEIMRLFTLLDARNPDNRDSTEDDLLEAADRELHRLLANTATLVGILEKQRSDRASIRAVADQNGELNEKLYQALQQLRIHQSKLIVDESEQAAQQLKKTQALVLILGLFGFAALIFISANVSNRITDGLDRAVEVTRAIADGELTVEIPRSTAIKTDEFDFLLLHIARMRDSLSHLLQQQKMSEARSRAVLRTMRDGVIKLDASGHILFANDVILELFGYEENELLGGSAAQLLAPHYAEADPAHLSASLRERREIPYLHQRFELDARRKDGSLFPIDLVLNEMIDDNGLILIGVIRDIGEQRQAKQALEDALEAAQVAVKTKDQFLANMSHEIRTPINAVIGFSLLAQEHHPNPKVRDYLEKIHASGTSLLGLINDILDISKIEAGKLVLEQIPFNPAEVVANVFNMLSLQARDKGLHLVAAPMPDLPRRLLGDPGRLNQVLVNLLSNAIKFTREGSVILTAEVMPIVGQSQHQHVTLHFTIQDTGIGMSEGQVDKLFSPFIQADSSMTRKYGGTGLGLAISRQLVEKMGGRIGVSSAPGQGSVFWFTLQAEVLADDETTPELPASPYRGKNVLVFESVPPMLHILEMYFEQLGAKARFVSTRAALASAVVADGWPDYLVIDSYRSNDWVAQARQMRETGYRGKIHVLADSSDPCPAADLAQIDVLIDKPLSLDRLLHAAAQATADAGGHAPASPLHSQHDFAGLRILLVDDNPFNREIGSELLERQGARISLAENGEEACHAVHEQDFDLVLMDVQMPVLDGYQAARRLRISHPELPIIALTAHAMSDERERVLASGMLDIVTKPIDPQNLYDCIARCLTLPAAGSTASRPAHARAADQPSSHPIFDPAAALARVGHNPTMLQRFFQLFVQHNAATVLGIREAFAQQQAHEIRRLAHALKGGAGTVGLVSLEDLAHRIEALAAAEPVASAELQPLIEQLLSAWQAAEQLDIAPLIESCLA